MLSRCDKAESLMRSYQSAMRELKNGALKVRKSDVERRSNFKIAEFVYYEQWWKKH